MNQKELKKARRICGKLLDCGKVTNKDIWRFRFYTVDAFPDALDEIEHLREMLDLAWKSLLMAEDEYQDTIQMFNEFRNRYCEFKIRDGDLPENPIVELKKQPSKSGRLTMSKPTYTDGDLLIADKDKLLEWEDGECEGIDVVRPATSKEIEVVAKKWVKENPRWILDWVTQNIINKHIIMPGDMIVAIPDYDYKNNFHIITPEDLEEK